MAWGRSPISGWPLLRRLRQVGMKTVTFGYVATLEDFASITARLTSRIERVAASGTYVVVGHSLGGVLLRAALHSLAPGTLLPSHVYLLGSPILPSRLAMRLKNNFMFRAIAGDCGQLLGSTERMRSIGPLNVPTTGIAGVRGLTGRHSPFGEEANDGVVSISEISAAWLSNQVQVPVVHTFLPSSEVVAKIIIEHLV